MFTGIIEEKGKCIGIHKGAVSCQLVIEAKKVLEGTKIGDSIAVNGVCLTVVEQTADTFTADVMNETLRRSNLGELGHGQEVNLERAMSANGRFGGHIVAGHVDTTGTIVSIKREKNAIWFTIKPECETLKYVIEKGSVALDGISLTVANVTDHTLSVSVIPHSMSETTLSDKKEGHTLNIEFDMVGKYVEKIMGYQEPQTKKSALTEDFLAQHGYM